MLQTAGAAVIRVPRSLIAYELDAESADRARRPLRGGPDDCGVEYPVAERLAATGYVPGILFESTSIEADFVIGNRLHQARGYPEETATLIPGCLTPHAWTGGSIRGFL